jgi:hypothetical protein
MMIKPVGELTSVEIEGMKAVAAHEKRTKTLTTSLSLGMHASG